MGYEDRVPNQMTTIRFKGLNTQDNPMAIKDFEAASLLNVEFEPAFSIRKRRGFAVLTDSGDAVDVPGGSGPVDGIGYLPKISDGASYLICERAGNVYQRKLAAGEEWEEGYHITTVGAKMSSTVARYYVGETFYGESLFCTNGEDEPYIVTGVAPASYWTGADTAVDQLHGGVATTELSVEIGTHGLADGDMVHFHDIDDSDWLALNGLTFRAEVIDADNFYLWDASLTRQEVPAGETWGSPAADGECDIGLAGIKRWPRAEYASPAGTYGYPARWDDPNDDDNAGWPEGDVQDWPKGIVAVGQGLGMRCLTWGFDLDKDRIDYSELGNPHNFAKASIWDDNANEAAAATNPPIDGGYFYCQRGDGDEVTGVIMILGL